MTDNGVGVIELTGLSVDVGIVVVLSWAAQLASLQDTAVVIKGNSVTFSLGGQDGLRSSKPLHTALLKLFKLPAPEVQDLPAGMQDNIKALIGGDNADVSQLVVPTSQAYGWLDEHKQVLQNLLATGQEIALSPGNAAAIGN
ncbi:hypothetical protein WJX79_006321 [Trebouxia sp. C0005]